MRANKAGGKTGKQASTELNRTEHVPDRNVVRGCLSAPETRHLRVHRFAAPDTTSHPLSQRKRRDSTSFACTVCPPTCEERAMVHVSSERLLMVFVGVLARDGLGPNCLTLSPSHPGNEFTPMGCISGQGSTALPQCTHVFNLNTARQSSPGRMSPKTIDESSLRVYAHMPKCRTSSRRDCIASPCRFALSSPLLKDPATPSSPSPRDSAEKGRVRSPRTRLAIASDGGLRGVNLLV